MTAPKNRGFTIVELLIVIVVIGILAAIVIVAYNGIQLRARNANTASVINAYKKALGQYAIEHQAYPSASSVCLGEDYPDTGVYTTANNRNCFRSSSSGYMINASFNNNIRPYMNNASKLPTPNNTVFGSGSSPWSARGAVFAITGSILDGTANPWMIIYTVEGQTQCPVGPIVDTSGWPNVSSTPPATGYTALLGGGTPGVECWVALPDPSKV